MQLPDLTAALGYSASSLYREGDAEAFVALPDRHWVRAARQAGTVGTYFFRTSPMEGALRPAVHVAEAGTQEEAREIHRKLWNQGVNPFVIVLLPGHVRVFSGFAFDPLSSEVGDVTGALPTGDGVTQIIEALSAFTADAINRGEIWRHNARHLGAEHRVDSTLLQNLQALAQTLEQKRQIPLPTCHALIGKFVYLSYLRAREILSDKWLRDEAGVDPSTVFKGEVFSPVITLQNFRTLVRAVEKRFNGKLFPIPWGSRHAPRADDVRLVARVFAGEEVTGQMHLSFRAYDFASIPVEFLSSIYEQFLHAAPSENESTDEEKETEPDNEAANPEKRGAHYTPEPLADYLVSEVHSVKPLCAGMKVLDACCGSGIFLAVAYRRLVELECQRQGRTTLHASELRELLVSSIYGVERNRIACEIAGFSLILAMLSYVDPPELHQRRNFRFPTLLRHNLFDEDFFNDKGRFWRQVVAADGMGLKFDCIYGNPPWVELDKDDPASAHILKWSKDHAAEYSLARARTGEAFAWRVTECMADDGVAGLILHAKTLTNDHLEGWRKKFFGSLRVHRITNFANLAYIIFPSAQAPAATVIYTRRRPEETPAPILHFGPFVANQCVTNPARGGKRRAWAIGFSESEICNVSQREASAGNAKTWKLALWSNARDEIALRLLRRVFTTTLGEIANKHGWTLSLGLQLRGNKGTERDPNEEVLDEHGQNVLSGVKILDHRALVRNGPVLTIPDHFVVDNPIGTFVRKGRHAGLALIRGSRLFLWNDFAAYSESTFIMRHSKVGLAGGTAKQMKAVAAVWTSSFASYFLFFVISSDWGIDRSMIDKGDAEKIPFPEFTPADEESLCAAWEEAAVLEANGADFDEVKAMLDLRVAAALSIPTSAVLIVSEFFRVRYRLNKGKSPANLRVLPDETELTAYARRLRDELDGFLGGKARHRVVILYSPKGISASVTVTRQRQTFDVAVHAARGAELHTLEGLLAAAETQFSQWVYVKRSIRLRDGDTMHIIKPPRRLEWTETQALLDADDIIGTALEKQQSTGA